MYDDIEPRVNPVDTSLANINLYILLTLDICYGDCFQSEIWLTWKTIDSTSLKCLFPLKLITHDFTLLWMSRTVGHETKSTVSCPKFLWRWDKNNNIQLLKNLFYLCYKEERFSWPQPIYYYLCKRQLIIIDKKLKNKYSCIAWKLILGGRLTPPPPANFQSTDFAR